MRALNRGMAPWKVGVLALAIVALITVAAFYKRNPLADRFEVRAAFRTANDLQPGSPVRIAGIEVGKVRAVEHGADGGALVRMEIADRGLPLHRDAQFKVRPRIFLEGNYFVDVSPGTPGAPELTEDDVVPVTQTAAPVQLGQVLELLQTDSREDLRTILQELGDALDQGGAEAFNRTTRFWAPAYKYNALVSDAARGLSGRNLSGYLRGAGRVAEGLDRDPAALKRLITDFAATMQAFASEQENLSATIDELPRTLRAGRAAFGELNTAFPPLRRLVAELRPTVRSSRPALEAQLPLVRQLQGLVGEGELRGLSRDLRATVPSLAALTKASVPLAEQQRLLSSCQVDVVHHWQEDTIQDPAFPATGKVYQEGVKWLPGIAGESRSFDANGQYVRSLAQPPNFAYPLGNDRFLFTATELGGVNPPRMRQPPFRADVPCETQEPPDLRTRVQAPPRAIRIDNTSPAALARRRRVERRLNAFVRDELKRRDVPLDFSDRPLRRADLPAVVRSLQGQAP